MTPAKPGIPLDPFVSFRVFRGQPGVDWFEIGVERKPLSGYTPAQEEA